ncbi:acidic phospholipase A2 PLA-2-like isoform X2 [Pezoporus flaviventris]|uniref:acidic phospholipase A2 PLA-2-like isoform X2 n=1 Tax=Pezoporus flaviventris TaxID=889875 RepID=UPI002AB2457B|nr:acidic phospholipase A2 PLA-2-like isoform X2 [Pezoporus flaviventris]
MLYVHGNTNVTVLRAPGAGVVASVLCLGYCSLPPVAVSSSRTALRMKNLLFTLLLACGLLPAHSSVLELEQMIRAATGRSALLSYSWYGCFCGIGGRGTPVDSTDQCCHAHDCCYRRLRQGTCTPLVTPYQFDVADGDIVCGDEQSWCKRETCLCDQAVASCFASTLPSYNKSYLFYFKLKCQGSKLQC